MHQRIKGILGQCIKGIAYAVSRVLSVLINAADPNGLRFTHHDELNDSSSLINRALKYLPRLFNSI